MATDAVPGGAVSPWDVCGVTLLPAVAMALGSAAVSVGGEPSERLQARLQHFSGGLLIGAVITDIFPILRSRLVKDTASGAAVVQTQSMLAGTLGFCVALAVMYGVKSLELDGLETEAEGSSRSWLPAPLAAAWARLFGSSSSPSPALPPQKEPLLPVLPPASPAPSEPRDQYANLSLAVAKLSARAQNLGHLAKVQEVDREAVDEEVHGLDFLIDMARRRCQSEADQPFDASCAARLRAHVGELTDDVVRARELDVADLPGIDAQLQVIAQTLRRVHSHADQRANPFRRWGPRPVQVQYTSSQQFCSEASPQLPPAASPWPSGPGGSLVASPLETAPVEAAKPAAAIPRGLVLAVLIDSCVDGMLIGLAGSVALPSGWLMAMATAIEMGFLGYSFACAVSEPVKVIGGAPLRLAVLAMPPLAMLAASAVAAAGATDVEHSPTFVGLIAFALVAVLFLVVEELLIEAHEKEGGGEWHISVWLYVGLLLSICLDVVTF